MKINHRIADVTGPFETDSGRLVCVPMPKYGEVLLCFQEKMNIPFAKIKLHSEDRYVDATAVLPDATALGNEIVARWNELPALKERERRCPSLQVAEARALLRGLQECAELLGLGVNASPSEVVQALRLRVTD